MKACRHVKEELDWVRRQMAADHSDVPERLLRQIHFEIAAGRRRAQQAASLHLESPEHTARVAMWESLDKECEALRREAAATAGMSRSGA